MCRITFRKHHAWVMMIASLISSSFMSHRRCKLWPSYSWESTRAGQRSGVECRGKSRGRWAPASLAERRAPYSNTPNCCRGWFTRGSLGDEFLLVKISLSADGSFAMWTECVFGIRQLDSKRANENSLDRNYWHFRRCKIVIIHTYYKAWRVIPSPPLWKSWQTGKKQAITIIYWLRKRTWKECRRSPDLGSGDPG